MTLLWFLIWLVADNLGDREPLVFAPVNIWAGVLMFAVAIDLSAAHATKRRGSS